MLLDYRVIMLSDANAANTDKEHSAALNTFIMFFGDVMTTDEVIARIATASPAKL
jgi:ureidoacrylate peracid hydrolase